MPTTPIMILATTLPISLQQHNITTSRQHHGNITATSREKKCIKGGEEAWSGELLGHQPPNGMQEALNIGWILSEYWVNIGWIFSESKVYPCMRQYLFQPIVMLTCIKSVLLNANKESIKLILLSFHICMGLVIREAGSGIIGGGSQNSIFCKSPQHWNK